jgi:hypothetical protein
MLATDTALRTLKHMPTAEVRELQDAHQMNLHADFDDDSLFDADDELEGLTIIDEAEFFERYFD